MRDTERLRLLYQNDGAFGVGVIVGKQETIDKACKWLREQMFGQEILLYEDDIEEFRKAMEE